MIKTLITQYSHTKQTTHVYLVMEKQQVKG